MTNNNNKDENGVNYLDFYEDSEAIIDAGKSMGFVGTPLKTDEAKIVKTLYEEQYLAQRNIKFITRVTNKALKEGKAPVISKVLDPLYADVLEEKIELYSKLFRKFIGLYYYDANGDPSNLIGFTSLPGVINEGDKVVINGVHIPNVSSLRNDSNGSTRMNFVYGIYDILLEEAENTILASTPANSVEIDFQTAIPRDGDLWLVLENRGYEVENSHDLPNGTIHFSKKLTRKKSDIYEGNTSRK